MNTTYGRENALFNGEQMYCLCGELYYTRNNQRVQGREKCEDWKNGRCKGLQEVTGVVR
jgi:hypothetical protein